MSKHLAREAVTRMNLRPVAVAPVYSTLASDLAYMANTTLQAENERFMDVRRAELVAAYGFQGAKQEKPFAFAEGVAIVPISGSLINRFASSYSGWVTGYNFITRQIGMAMVDDDVKAIIYDVNSNGGEVAGCFETAAIIRLASRTKPSTAIVDSNCYSAAYGLSSSASKIIVTPSGGAGSIGVVAMHVDMSKMLEESGYKVTFIHAGAHKVDGNPYEALSDEVRADIQKSVNASYDKFTALVAANRSMDQKAIRDTEARIYSADDALRLGLIDAIASPAEAMSAFLGELSGSTSQPRKEDDMSENATQPGAQGAGQQGHTAADLQKAETAAANTARLAERARVEGILSSAEAKGKGKLASHLAMKTDMSVDDAKAMLAVAAAETPEQGAAAPDNAFKAAMDADKHPNVGADGAGAGAGGGEMSAAEKILRAQAAANGQEYKPQA